MSLVARKMALARMLQPLKPVLSWELDLWQSQILGAVPLVRLRGVIRYGDLHWTLGQLGVLLPVVDSMDGGAVEPNPAGEFPSLLKSTLPCTSQDLSDRPLGDNSPEYSTEVHSAGMDKSEILSHPHLKKAQEIVHLFVTPILNSGGVVWGPDAIGSDGSFPWGDDASGEGVFCAWNWLDWCRIMPQMQAWQGQEHPCKVSDALQKHMAQWECLAQIPEEMEVPGLSQDYALLSHQRVGVQTMAFWAQSASGGILADDMGLGKTLQTLAVLAQLQIWHQHPVLLICPMALVDNWMAEIQKFFPHLKTLALQGSQRAKERWRAARSQIVILSYGVLRRDVDWVQSQKWSACVADEAHLAKNPKSAVYQALLKIQTSWKLALTGTPVQNRPAELHALLTWLHGPRWGAAKDFIENWSHRPDWRTEVGQLLLRRLKSDVLKDLPPCTTQDLYAEFCSQQKAAYRKVLEGRELVLERISQVGMSRGAVSLLALLQKLRHVTNGSEEYCAKWPLALAELQSAQAAQEKVLIFAQSRKLLDRLEFLCQEQGYRTLRLDGRTSQAQRRQSMLDFQQKPGFTVFLLSTRAAGVGLNLTAARKVLFWEHDWNPSWDLQARDRAHRIGQKFPVEVKRLLARGSFEECLLRRCEQKREMSEAMLQGQSLLDWSLEEIKDLLKDFEAQVQESSSNKEVPVVLATETHQVNENVILGEVQSAAPRWHSTPHQESSQVGWVA